MDSGADIPGFDQQFDEMLVVNRLFYGKIVRVTRDFYRAYLKKCNEYNCYMNFFEVLYAYLIGYGFRHRKIAKYIEMISSKIRSEISKAKNISQHRGQSED